ncbi:MAG TPA: mechanosensitive ion channel family protein [Solirubrobacteraceae bacterium]|nr:mechanosensitive ion channel family protein [Solirubrobacteraceae bacterium]
MRNPLRKDGEPREVKFDRNLRMFETRSHEWERAGLRLEPDRPAIRRAQRQALVVLPLLVGVLFVWFDRHDIVGSSTASSTGFQVGVVVALVVLGWAFSRDLGKAAAPTFFKRMDPPTAGTVGFLIRLATIAITIVLALHIVGLNPATIAAGGAFTAIVFGLAAQQTLGNVIAGMVLLSARPFRVGQRIRLQAGAVGGFTEGVVSSLGLLYTTLRRGDDQIMIPNNVVLASVVVPLVEPDAVDVRIRLSSGIRPGRVQAILDESVSTPTRLKPRVLLEEIDGDKLVVRVQATPVRAADGAGLADEIIAALTSVTGEQTTAAGDEPQPRTAGTFSRSTRA